MTKFPNRRWENSAVRLWYNAYMGKRQDLTGKRFGKLEVKEFARKNSRGVRLWRCLCDCGGENIVSTSHLNSGHTKSCGCLYKKHGMYGTRPYRIHRSMLTRCRNKKHVHYNRYGGRGIKVCDEWLSFKGFWKDMKKGYKDSLTIDRIDTNGNYRKDNCRWATYKEQGKNRDPNAVKKHKANGEEHTISEWSKILEINPSTLYTRIHRGWEHARVFKKDICKYSTWSRKCTCSGVSLCGLIPIFIHHKSCPLSSQGVKNWQDI